MKFAEARIHLFKKYYRAEVFAGESKMIFPICDALAALSFRTTSSHEASVGP